MAADPDVRAPQMDGAPAGTAGTPAAPSSATRTSPRVPLWAQLVGAVLAVVVVLVALAVAGTRSLPERLGPPVEELAVERTELAPGVIELTVRNVGPDPVQVAQVFVNDSFVDFTGGTEPIPRLGTATLTLDQPWQEGQPYLVSLLTSTGLVIEHEIPAAVATPDDTGVLGRMALLGAYIGIVPVALGMLALPLLRRAGPGTVRLLLALAVGLLAFLALDAGIEAVELGAESGGAFGGPVLAALGAVLAYLALSALDGVLRHRRGTASDGVSGLRFAVLIAIGIGLHNLGEGLAVGSAFAVGELALGASLVLGFALHNLTEGVAIVAPLARERARLLQLAGLGLIAGAPAVLGAVLGVSVRNPEVSVFLLGLGIGAIVQVVVVLVPAVRSGRRMAPAALGAIVAGVLLMYATGLLVTA